VSDAVPASEISHEQTKLDQFYARLDEVRGEAALALDQAQLSTTAGTPGSRSEREAFIALHADRLRRLEAVEDRLCFGRLDLHEEVRRYVGRVGLTDEAGARLLIDWRAPAAQAFYRATQANPDGAILRRYLVTNGRTVTGVQDEVLDLDAYTAAGGDQSTVGGEGALLLALNANRTGQMRDIVATIQAEQDRIIRAPMGGVLVVQGGPGTGKTAVALHRAAYLLYAHRDRIATSGVLMVGPNDRFLRYIEQVLPSLGETGVVLSTLGQLYPSVDAATTDSAVVAEIKGSLRMADVIAGAVRARQRVPNRTRTFNLDGTTISMTPDDVRDSIGRARSSRRPHNVARVQFVTDLLEKLARKLAAARDTTLNNDTRDDLIAALRESRDVRREINLCWMPLDPQRLLVDLFSSASALGAAGGRWLSRAERSALLRPRDAEWTSADVPLLDEAAELIAGDEDEDPEAEARAAAERAIQLEYAQGVLDVWEDAGEMMTAEALVDRQVSTPTYRPAHERAANDRTWVFAHVIVDEAQELSAMQWRVLMRRCPSRSMTVVGDIAQTSSPAGARSWDEMLHPYVADRWRREELTVNYRTPGRIMTVATALLHAAGFDPSTPSSARPGRWAPTANPIEAGDTDAVARFVAREFVRLGVGALAVVTPHARHDAISAAVAGVLPAAPDVSVLTIDQAKGLEFDSVIVVEPAEIVAEGPRGTNDLYVALTRPTQRLALLHSTPLPAGLTELKCRRQ
jgi:DNA helicase IV